MMQTRIRLSKSPLTPRPERTQVRLAILIFPSPGLPNKRETCSSFLRDFLSNFAPNEVSQVKTCPIRRLFTPKPMRRQPWQPTLCFPSSRHLPAPAVSRWKRVISHWPVAFFPNFLNTSRHRSVSEMLWQSLGLWPSNRRPTSLSCPTSALPSPNSREPLPNFRARATHCPNIRRILRMMSRQQSRPNMTKSKGVPSIRCCARGIPIVELPRP